MWFDEHRGRLVRHEEYGTWPPPTAHFLDDNRVWQQMPYTPSSTPPVFAYGTHDPKRNRFYTIYLNQPANNQISYLTDLYPAEYEHHGTGCVGSAPSLTLRETWTRAWIGSTLELQVQSAPLPFAMLVSGLSDQFASGAPLPIDLTVAGMPQCMLRVSPDSLILGSGTAGTIDFAINIPMQPAIIGIEFFHQAIVLAPGANSVGLLATNSNRGTVGRSH